MQSLSQSLLNFQFNHLKITSLVYYVYCLQKWRTDLNFCFVRLVFNQFVLQDWVKAVAIRITLNRINTFGDEVFRDPKILRSYYYAISDLSIGGR